MVDTKAFSNPRLEAGPSILLCGEYGPFSAGSLGQLRQRLQEGVEAAGTVLYGVRMAAERAGEARCLYGVEVPESPEEREEFTLLRLEPRTYCVVVHKGPFSTLAETWEEVLEYGAPPGFQADDAPGLERFDERYDVESGSGEIEVWFPVRPF
jgi:AraC family transcriptional regulator